MSAPSAYRIEQAMSAATAFAARLRADDPDTDHASLLEALDSETDAIALLRRVIRAAMEAETFEDAVGARMKALADRKARFGRRSDAARGLAFAMMDALGLSSLPDAEFTATISAPRAKAIIADEAALPDAFVRVTRAPDMAAIHAAVKAGQTPSGVGLANGMPTLTIRTK